MWWMTNEFRSDCRVPVRDVACGWRTSILDMVGVSCSLSGITCISIYCNYYTGDCGHNVYYDIIVPQVVVFLLFLLLYWYYQCENKTTISTTSMFGIIYFTRYSTSTKHIFYKLYNSTASVFFRWQITLLLDLCFNQGPMCHYTVQIEQIIYFL